MLEAGSVLQGRYRVEEPLREDASGRRYSASCAVTRRPVVVKEVFAHGLEPNRQAAAFRREVEPLLRVRHAAMSRVLAAFEESGRFFLVLDEVNGEPLPELLQDEHVGLVQALIWIDELLTLLTALHGQAPPIIARSIEPENLVVTAEGHLVLVDVALPGFVTPAPLSSFYEAGRGTTDDPGFDLYSVGAVFYALLHLAPPSADALDLGPRTPAFDTLVRALVHPERNLRYASAADAQRALRPFREKVMRLYGPPSDGDLSASGRRRRSEETDRWSRPTGKEARSGRRKLSTSMVGEKPTEPSEADVSADRGVPAPPPARVAGPGPATRPAGPSRPTTRVGEAKAPPDDRVPAPAASAAGTDGGTATLEIPAAAVGLEPTPRPAASRRGMLALAAVVLLVCGALTFWLVSLAQVDVPPVSADLPASPAEAPRPDPADSGPAESDETASPSAGASAGPLSPPLGTTSATASAAPSAASSPTAAPSAAASPTASAAAPAVALPSTTAAVPAPSPLSIQVDSSPPGAWVRIEGGPPVGRTPCRISLPPRDKPYRLVLSRPGYDPARALVRTAQPPGVVRVTLRALPAAPTHHPAPAYRPAPPYRPTYSRPRPPPPPPPRPRERIQLPD